MKLTFFRYELVPFNEHDELVSVTRNRCIFVYFYFKIFYP